MKRYLLILLALLVMPGAVQAAPTGAGRHYTAILASKSASVKAGKPIQLALAITPEKGWHIYWSNPGGSGYAPALSWTLPNGFKPGELRHPVPQELLLGGIHSNVHTGETILLEDIAVPASLRVGGTVPLSVDLDLLVCSDSSCVPDPLRLTLSLPAGTGTTDPHNALLFDRAEHRLPQPFGGSASFAIEGPDLVLYLPGTTIKPGEHAHIFTSVQSALIEGAQQLFEQQRDALVAHLSYGPGLAGSQLAGVLRIDAKDGTSRAYSFEAKRLAAASASPAKMSTLDFALAFGGALLGGLLLNLMPCVFPILSLKALALARTGGTDHEARSEALGYSIGSIVTIMALGAILLILRGAGQSLGWAFQLQDMRVVALLLLLVTAIATNLAGLYELSTPNIGGTAQKGFAGAVSTGALAAFIATPCTGPFMAGALGAALVMPAAAAMAVFFGLGLGLALPFLALGFVKPARKWLPKPGAWMNTLRRILSIPMFLTALGLAWLLGRQAGANAMAWGLLSALVLVLGLWWLGLRQHAGKRTWPSYWPIAASTLFSIAIFGPGSAGAAQPVNIEAEAGVVPFDQAELTSLRNQHKPVFLYMTADWCLSCKVNEATSLSAKSVKDAFDSAGVTVMRGDWTTEDPKISAYLKTRGSAGVPLYVWYPAHGEPIGLPQVLTPNMLVSLIGSR